MPRKNNLCNSILTFCQPHRVTPAPEKEKKKSFDGHFLLYTRTTVEVISSRKKKITNPSLVKLGFTAKIYIWRDRWKNIILNGRRGKAQKRLTNKGSSKRSTDKGHNNRPESPTVTPPGMRVKTKYINSTKGTPSKKERKHWALRPQKPLRLIRDGEVGGSEFFLSDTYSLHRHHQNDSALRWAAVWAILMFH